MSANPTETKCFEERVWGVIAVLDICNKLDAAFTDWKLQDDTSIPIDVRMVEEEAYALTNEDSAEEVFSGVEFIDHNC
jgi:hypothetical protein